MGDCNFFKSGGGGGAGSGIALKSNFNTNTSMADPGSGNFRLNNATPASVTAIAISYTTTSGVNAEALIDSLHDGDYIYIQQIGAETKYILARVTANTNNTTWAQLTVVIEDSDTIFDSGVECGLSFNYASDDVDDFQDYDEIAEPADPSSNVLRVFAEDDNGFGVLNVKDSTGLKIRLGRDQYVLVANNTGAPLTIGQVVYYNGNATGDIPDVDLAQANSPTTMPAIGIVEEAIANGAIGRVAIGGVIDNVNTAAFSAGDDIYVSDSVAGGLTTTPPTHPNLRQRIAIIKTSNATTGSALINIGLNPDGDSFGTRENAFKIGDATAGEKSLEFENGNTMSLNANPSANRALSLPDINGTLGEKDVYRLISGDDANFDTSIGSWLTYADAAGTEPVDGTGGSPNITFPHSTSSPLIGPGMGVLTKDAADRQGEGISLSSISVPDGLRGRPLLVRCITEGSANYADGDVVLFAYDETNSEIIGGGPLVNQDDGQILQAKGITEAIVYPKSDTATIRIIAHIATTNASAWTLNIGKVDFDWVPFIRLPGSSAPKPYTPVFSGLGTVTNIDFRSMIDGSNLIVEGYATAGTVAASEMRISLPDGYTINGTTSISVAGLLARGNNGSTIPYVLKEDGQTYMTFGRQGSGNAALNKQNGSQILISSENFSIRAVFPVNELSANTTEALALNSQLQNVTKYLTSDITADTTTISDLTIDTLVPGRQYLLIMNPYMLHASSAPSSFGELEAVHDGSVILAFREQNDGGTSAVQTANNKSKSRIFTATTDTVTFNFDEGSDTTLLGDNTDQETFVQIQELPFSQTALIQRAPDIELFLDTGNGRGSTDTAIRRFSNIRKNTLGSYATLTQSATLGDSVTINSKGLWSITYTDHDSIVQSFGISVNSSNNSTSIVSLTYAQGKRGETSNVANGASSHTTVLTLDSGDVVRPHTNTSVNGSTSRTTFQVKYLGRA